MPKDVENPMVTGNYYGQAQAVRIAQLDTPKARETWIAENRLEYAAAAMALRVRPESVDALADTLSKVWRLMHRHDPETVERWNARIVKLNPYAGMYHEWLLSLNEKL